MNIQTNNRTAREDAPCASTAPAEWNYRYSRRQGDPALPLGKTAPLTFSIAPVADEDPGDALQDITEHIIGSPVKSLIKSGMRFEKRCMVWSSSLEALR
jgi:hypothetical protein